MHGGETPHTQTRRNQTDQESAHAPQTHQNTTLRTLAAVNIRFGVAGWLSGVLVAYAAASRGWGQLKRRTGGGFSGWAPRPTSLTRR